MQEKKRIISNTGNFFCFNSNVSNLYNTIMMLYFIKRKKKEENIIVNEFTEFSYCTFDQIIKLVYEKNCKNTGLYQQPVTDIRDRIYNSMAGGFIVQVIKEWEGVDFLTLVSIMIIYTCTTALINFTFIVDIRIVCHGNH